MKKLLLIRSVRCHAILAAAAILLAVVLSGATNTANAATTSWDVASGDWTTDLNWNPVTVGGPSGIGEIVNRTTTTDSTTTVDANKTVGVLSFGAVTGTAMGLTTKWGISQTTGNLTLDNGGASVNLGSTSITGALIQNGNTTANTTSTQLSISGGTLTLNDNLTIINRSGGATTTTAAPLVISSVIAGTNKNVTFGAVYPNWVSVGAGAQLLDTTSLKGATVIQGTNTFTGNVSILDGLVITDNVAGMGASTNVITVGDHNTSNAAQFMLRGNVNIPNPIQTVANTYNAAQIGTELANPAAAGEFSGSITVAPSSVITVTSLAESAFLQPAEGDVGLTISGLISGAGGFDKNGGIGNLGTRGFGSVTVTKTDNTYTGITMISKGQLRVTSLKDVGVASSLGAPVNAADGTIFMGTNGVEYSGGSPTAPGLPLVGNIGGFASTALTYIGPGDTTNRNISLVQAANVTASLRSAGAGALVVTGNINSNTTTAGKIFDLGGSNTGDNTISGNITNSQGTLRLTKSNAGKWILSGSNTYSGTTTVNAGTLLINGTNSGGGAFTVASSATLGGKGTIGSTVNLSGGGTLAPGGSPGKLTVDALTVSAGANFAFELDPSNTAPGDNSNNNDLIAVTGALTLNLPNLGDTVNLNIQDSVTPGDFGGVGTWTLETFGSLTGFATPGTFDITSFVNVTGLAGNIASYAINANVISGGSGDITLTTIPEPSAIVLGVFGLAFAGCVIRRKQK